MATVCIFFFFFFYLSNPLYTPLSLPPGQQKRDNVFSGTILARIEWQPQASLAIIKKGKREEEGRGGKRKISTGERGVRINHNIEKDYNATIPQIVRGAKLEEDDKERGGGCMRTEGQIQSIEWG